MTDIDIAFRPATDLAADIRARRLSPVEVTRAALDRIEASQPVLNAFITVASEQAMAQARAAEAAVLRGDALGPLHGVPIAVKDLVPTAGIRTTWGSLIYQDHIPDTDAVVMARLKQAGAIIVGKTTTPEFGQQCLTQAPLFGRTATPGGQTERRAGPAAARRWRWPPGWCRWRWRRMAVAPPASRRRAMAWWDSSRGWAWCRRNTRRMGLATYPTSRR
jgi:Asp-tRNA(Asn)/Glu-tRNA(Gln) amidotransferase A subunit family amidase